MLPRVLRLAAPHAAPVRLYMTPPGPGMGVGNIRTGIHAIHRGQGMQPLFLEMPKTVSIVGAPMTYGQPVLGPDLGPKSLRDAGLHSAIKRLSWRLDDTGDLDLSGSRADSRIEYTGKGACNLPVLVGNGMKKIAAATAAVAAKGRFCLTLGGDHSLSMGTIFGLLTKYPNLGVVWVDAHADINWPAVSESGNMHGMPLSFLMGLVEPDSVPGFSWIKDYPRLSPEQLVYVGLRDVDKAEREIIRELKIRAFTMSHVDKFGIGAVMNEAIGMLEGRPLHLSYDIDACDPAVAPHTGTAVRGGLTFREAHSVAEMLADTGALVSMDMVEVNPSHSGDDEDVGSSEETVELGLQLIASALGNSII